MDDQVSLAKQIEHNVRPVVLLSTSGEARTRCLAGFQKQFAIMRKQPGFISAQLHRAIAGSSLFMNYVIWESTDAGGTVTAVSASHRGAVIDSGFGPPVCSRSSGLRRFHESRRAQKTRISMCLPPASCAIGSIWRLGSKNPALKRLAAGVQVPPWPPCLYYWQVFAVGTQPLHFSLFCRARTITLNKCKYIGLPQKVTGW
jgi:antibiotic biosynthesis monooxygenase